MRAGAAAPGPGPPGAPSSARVPQLPMQGSAQARPPAPLPAWASGNNCPTTARLRRAPSGPTWSQGVEIPGGNPAGTGNGLRPPRMVGPDGGQHRGQRDSQAPAPSSGLEPRGGGEADVRPPGAHLPHPDPNPAWGLAQYSPYIRHHFFCVAPISHRDRKRRPFVGMIMTSAPGVPEKPLSMLDITQHLAAPGPGEAAKAGVSTAPQV